MPSQTPELSALKLHQQAILKLNDRDWDGAIAACQQALELQPNLAIACKTLGVALQFQNRLDEAKQWYQKAIELQPDFAEAHANLGSLYAKQCRWEAAIGAYQTALKINPNLAGIYRNLAKVFTEFDDIKQAIECQYRALKLEPNPGSSEDYLKLGNRAAKGEEREKAVAHYQQAIASNPRSFKAYHNLGEALNILGRNESAIACYQNAIALNPTSTITYRCLEKTLLNLGDRERLIAVYRQHLQAEPNCFETHQNLAQLLLDRGQYEAAIELYLKAVEIKPDYPWFYRNLWNILARHQQLGRAIAILRRAIAQYPDAPKIELNLGQILSRQGNLPEAIAAYRKAGHKNLLRSHPEIARKYWDEARPSPPHFIIIGAQKGGTTSLYNYLQAHPQIVGCIQKETHFWNYHFQWGLDWYLSHFPHLAPESGIQTGEATPNYLEAEAVPRRLFQAFPQIKLIVLLRDPVHRAISQYHHWVRLMLESRTLEEAMQSELDAMTATSGGEWIASSHHPRYIWRGLYVRFLTNWMSVFERSQFLILRSEDLYENPHEIFERVLDFLGLPACQLAEYSRHNRGHYATAETEISARLRDYFRPHNRALENFLNLEFNWD